MAKKIDTLLREALLKRALGYEYDEKTVIAGKSGKPEKVQVVKKHVPPDLEALEMIEQLKLAGRW